MLRILRGVKGIHFQALITVLLIMATFVSGRMILIFIPFLLGATVIVRAKPDQAFCWLLFFLPISTIIKYSPGAVSLFTFWELAYVIKMMVKCKRLPHTTRTSFFFILFFVYLMLLSAPNGSVPSIIISIGGMALPLLCGLFATSRFAEISYSQSYLYFSYGVVLSNFIGLFINRIPTMRSFSVSILRDTVADNFDGLGTGVARFYGIWGDPNILAIYTACALGCLTALFLDKKIKTPVWAVMTVFLVITGALTISKTFLLIVAALILLVIIASFVHRDVKLALQIIAGVIVLGLVFYLVLRWFNLHEIVEKYLFRFNKSAESGSMDSLTSGRTSIWMRYLNSLGRGVKIFTGYGYGGGVFRGKAPHSTYIQVMYMCGIFGVTIFLTFLYNWVKSVKARVLSGAHSFVSRNFLIFLLVFLINIFTLDTFAWDIFYFMISLAVIGGWETLGSPVEEVAGTEEGEESEEGEGEKTDEKPAVVDK